jgi:hypothetical protein
MITCFGLRVGQFAIIKSGSSVRQGVPAYSISFAFCAPTKVIEFRENSKP